MRRALDGHMQMFQGRYCLRLLWARTQAKNFNKAI
jgi:hypothetical protein